MTENLPATSPPKNSITITLPRVDVVVDAIKEDGPVRWHFLTACTIAAAGLVILFFVAYPAIFWALTFIVLALAAYAFVHWTVFNTFFNKDPY